MEVNPVAIVNHFGMLVAKEFPQYSQANPTEFEGLIAKKLLDRFYAILTDAVFEQDDDLEEIFPSQGSSFSQELVVDEAGTSVRPEFTGGIPVERKLEILKLIEQHPNWSIQTIQRHGGKEFKHRCYKKQWEDHVKAGGTRYEKLKHINKYTWERFQEARKGLQSVKDRHLQAWAVQALQSFRDSSFMFSASHGWVNDFKKRYGISSRKITRLVSKNDVRSMDEILKNAAAFQVDVK
ncbi:unnamed protein product [Orchesella dallaii]|uniref:HTH CENPB-type domain-containing protein n=1 Tax=Orchesella dallaii TaxID=48710 RepID=A0ABP1Q440_9HEXA